MGILPWPPSPISGFSCLRSSENPLPLLFDLSPNLPLSFYLCFAAATTIYNLLFTLTTRREVCPLIILVHDLSHVSMHVQCVHLPSSSCGIWSQRHAGIYRNSVTTTSPISHVFHLQDFYLFSFTFCFVLSLLGRSSRPMRCKLS